MREQDKFQLISFGQDNPEFTFDDYKLAKKVLRLANRHQKQCENSCNGEGWVNGQRYYSGNIDDYARMTYGNNIKPAYLNEDENVFDNEANRINERIRALIGTRALWKLEFQGDPRGYTVKVFYSGVLLNNIL